MTTSPPHLNPVTVRLGLGVLARREWEVVLHLLSCQECRDGFLREVELGDDPPPDAGAGGQGDLSLDQALDRAEQSVRDRVPAMAREREEARTLLDDLLKLPPSQWKSFFARPLPAAFLELVLDTASRAVEADPATSLALAQRVRPAIDRADLPATLRQELVAQSWLVNGQVLVRAKAWLEADAAFGQAGRALASAAASPAAAELCRCVADFYQRQGRPIEAAALLGQAARLAGSSEGVLAEIGDLDRQARLLDLAGQPDQAVGLLAAALLRAEAAGAEVSELYLRLRLVWTLRTLGQDREALTIAPPGLLVEAASGVSAGVVQLTALLGNAFHRGDAMVMAAAALSLLQIHVRAGAAGPLACLAPIVQRLSSNEDFHPATRDALAALHAALRDRTGSLDPLLLAAAAALDRHEAQRLLN